MTSALDLATALGSFDEPWQPHLLATVNDHEVKVAKLEGAFVWHAHPDSDELFLVVDGRLSIEMRDGAVDLGPGQLYVVPRGTEHRPVAEQGASVVMIELAGTVNTGDAGGDRTVEVRPVG